MEESGQVDTFEGLISVEEAATRLGVSRRTVRRHIESGRLAGRKIGREYVTHVSALPADEIDEEAA